MSKIIKYRPVQEELNSEMMRYNRNGTTSITPYNKKLSIYRVPEAGCYRLEDTTNLMFMYLLYNITYLMYTRIKTFICAGSYKEQNLASILCARLGIMFNGILAEELRNCRAGNFDVLLTLSGVHEDVADGGILLEINTDREKVRVQVCLTAPMEVKVKNFYEYMERFNASTFPKNIGDFYEFVLNKCENGQTFGKILKPGILAERIMQENLPEIYNKSISQPLSTDTLTNLSLKSYLIANQNLVPVIGNSKGLSPKAYMHQLTEQTKAVFSNKLGELVRQGQYNKKTLYTMLMANMLFSTASKYRRILMIENLSKYVDDSSEEFVNYFDFISQNMVTIFYT